MSFKSTRAHARLLKDLKEIHLNAASLGATIQVSREHSSSHESSRMHSLLGASISFHRIV